MSKSIINHIATDRKSPKGDCNASASYFPGWEVVVFQTQWETIWKWKHVTKNFFSYIFLWNEEVMELPLWNTKLVSI